MSVSKSVIVKGSLLAGIAVAGTYGLALAGGGGLTMSAAAAKPSAGPTVLQPPDVAPPHADSSQHATEPALATVLRLTSATPVHMPLDPYLTPLSQVRLLDAGEKVATANCMHSLGFRDWTASTVQTRVASDHGDVDFIDYLDPSAAKGGYPAQDLSPTTRAQTGPMGPVRTPSQEEMQAYNGSKQLTAAGQKIPPGGCDKAGERAIVGTETLKADPRSLESMARTNAIQDSRVVHAIATWSSCMASSGFHYHTPLDAQFYSPWSQRLPGTTASSQELKVGAADATCRIKTNLAGIYKSVEIAYQQRQLDMNKTAIETSLITFKGWVNRAHSILGY